MEFDDRHADEQNGGKLKRRTKACHRKGWRQHDMNKGPFGHELTSSPTGQQPPGPYSNRTKLCFAVDETRGNHVFSHPGDLSSILRSHYQSNDESPPRINSNHHASIKSPKKETDSIIEKQIPSRFNSVYQNDRLTDLKGRCLVTNPKQIEKNQTHISRQDRDSYQTGLEYKFINVWTDQMISFKHNRKFNFSTTQIILIIFIVNVITSQLSNHLINLPTMNDKKQFSSNIARIFPTVVTASATMADVNTECRKDSDCDDMRCYQGKCICPKERPIEDKGVCLPLTLINEPCSISEQCLGNSICMDGFCSCANTTVSLYNPSTKIIYCHPKRRLNEECGNDAQCPNDSFCSTNKCLCNNGYGPATLKNVDGAESVECLPKRCARSTDCESEYHVCIENRCFCLADHFDPHTAGCYKFGSTGGKLSGNQTIDETATSSPNNDASGKGFNSILQDLMKNSDKLWYIIIVLVVLTILLLALIVMSVRKYFLGYCWTAHKKEYEPNNESTPRSGYFNKDSINNKSFRQKTGEADDDDGDDNDDTAADRSNLVTTVNKNRAVSYTNGNQQRPTNNKQFADSENRYVKVGASVTDEDRQRPYRQDGSIDAQYQAGHQQLLNCPLPTSNSTAV